MRKPLPSISRFPNRSREIFSNGRAATNCSRDCGAMPKRFPTSAPSTSTSAGCAPSSAASPTPCGRSAARATASTSTPRLLCAPASDGSIRRANDRSASRSRSASWARTSPEAGDSTRHRPQPPNASAAGLTPGRYHLMRHNPGAPPSLMVIEDEQGRFMEPGSRLLDEVRSRDLWSDGAVEARRQARLEAERRAVAAKERENEERRADLQERWDAVSRAQVSMNLDAAWTQNNSPAARRARAEARKSEGACADKRPSGDAAPRAPKRGPAGCRVRRPPPAARARP